MLTRILKIGALVVVFGAASLASALSERSQCHLDCGKDAASRERYCLKLELERDKQRCLADNNELEWECLKRCASK